MVAEWLSRPSFEPEDNQDVWQDPAFRGSIYQQHHDRSFWNSRSWAKTQAIIARIDREIEGGDADAVLGDADAVLVLNLGGGLAGADAAVDDD